MADNSVSTWAYNYGRKSTPVDALSQQIDELSSYIRGEDAKIGGRVPKNPVDIARREISNIYSTREATKAALPDLFQSYLNRIAGGTVDPEEARYAYLDLARSSGGNLADAYKQSEILGAQAPGFVASERYERFKPAASLATEQLLGRTLGDQEFKNYVSAAQGLGISKGADFQAFLGKTLLSSPEYKSQAVIFDPNKVSSALQTARKSPTVQEFASMLG